MVADGGRDEKGIQQERERCHSVKCVRERARWREREREGEFM